VNAPDVDDGEPPVLLWNKLMVWNANLNVTNGLWEEIHARHLAAVEAKNKNKQAALTVL